MPEANGLTKYTVFPLGKNKWAFKNFRWTLPGAIARASQPYYLSTDKPHTLRMMDVGFLKGLGISCVISANHCDMDADGRRHLETGGIEFHHFKVKDFHPPTPGQLKTAAGIIEGVRQKGRATLVFCGFGKGRTGTFIAA